jgi:hypothetical protein
MVARVCLVILLNHSEGIVRQSDGNKNGAPGVYPYDSIWGYVSRYWHHHVQTQDKPGCEALLARLLKRFLNSPMTPSVEYKN